MNIRQITLNDDGSGYTSTPNVAISTAPFAAGNIDATDVAITTTRGGVFAIERSQLTQRKTNKLVGIQMDKNPNISYGTLFACLYLHDNCIN